MGVVDVSNRVARKKPGNGRDSENHSTIFGGQDYFEHTSPFPDFRHDRFGGDFHGHTHRRHRARLACRNRLTSKFNSWGQHYRVCGFRVYWWRKVFRLGAASRGATRLFLMRTLAIRPCAGATAVRTGFEPRRRKPGLNISKSLPGGREVHS